MDWWLYALAGAFAAAATTVLAKAGVRGVPSNLATAVRALVVALLACLIALALGEHEQLPNVGERALWFLGLSGVTTGISWLAYFKALALAPASRVAPVDKSSLALTVLFAALFLDETITLSVGLGSLLIVGGALLTLAAPEPANLEPARGPRSHAWLGFALLAAIAAAATAILAKIGIENVPSNLATALRCIVVLAFAWGIVFARREHRALPSLSRRSVLFLVASGLGTGISWLAYYQALALAPASQVAPLDKSSLGLTILFAMLFLHERITSRLVLGVGLIIGGALLTLLDA